MPLNCPATKRRCQPVGLPPLPAGTPVVCPSLRASSSAGEALTLQGCLAGPSALFSMPLKDHTHILGTLFLTHHGRLLFCRELIMVQALARCTAATSQRACLHLCAPRLGVQRQHAHTLDAAAMPAADFCAGVCGVLLLHQQAW